MIEKIKPVIHFGAREATVTDIHNALVPYYNKINELIETVNSLQDKKEEPCKHVTSDEEREEHCCSCDGCKLDSTD